MLQRFFVYLDEHFPFLMQGILLVVIGICGINFSMRARGLANDIILPDKLESLPILLSVLLAFIGAVSFFVQLRLVEEAKNKADHLKFRLYRAAPQAVASSRKLATIAFVLMPIQIGLACWLNVQLRWPLLLVWSYLWLMRHAFFVQKWRKPRPLCYGLAHWVIMPLIFLYMTACDWMVVRAAPPPGLPWFLLVGFFTGLNFEIGYKIRAPRDEESDVATYSKLWGRRTAVTAWLSVMVLTGATTIMTARFLHLGTLMFALIIILLTAGVLIGDRFLQSPITAYASSIKKFSAIYALVLYLSLTIMPFFALFR